MKHRVALAPVVAAALMLSAGSAHADDADGPFLQAVQSKGLAQYFSSPGDEVSNAQHICTSLRNGGNPESMSFIIARDHHMNKGQVENFITTSVDFYCPDIPRPQF